MATGHAAGTAELLLLLLELELELLLLALPPSPAAKSADTGTAVMVAAASTVPSESISTRVTVLIEKHRGLNTRTGPKKKRLTSSTCVLEHTCPYWLAKQIRTGSTPRQHTHADHTSHLAIMNT